jgi:hypothetical protein
VRPFVAGADTNFEGVAGLNSADPALSQHTSVEEGIARSIRECDEAKSLLGVEPFDDPTNRWAGRGLDGCSVEPGSGAEGTRLWIVGICIELATPRVKEILMLHFGSWRVRPITSVGRNCRSFIDRLGS